MALNKEWHRSHRMPHKETREQSTKCHAVPAAECGCRAITESIRPHARNAAKRPACAAELIALHYR